ncbi:hypothetical protein ABTX81_30445 [Kitasatospora sp. NPDC097605]|uniref:hypothetical protein n=1 Tax=Kitasatospora sp. NPDC097605 TaxID=3157226 RepID=UPI003333E52A
MNTTPLPADHQHPVTFKWATRRRVPQSLWAVPAVGRHWTVTASWRGMVFTVAALPATASRGPAWYITRSPAPSLNPRKWTPCIAGAKACEWGTKGQPDAEAAMLAHITRRRAAEAKHRAAQAADAGRPPAPWSSRLPDLLGPVPRITYAPLEDDPTSAAARARIAELAEQGVTFEVIGG